MNALALSRVWNVASLIYVLRWVSAELNTLIFRFFWSGKLTVLWCNLFVWVVDSGIEFCLVLSITTRSAYLLLLSETAFLPHCEFFHLFGSLYWSWTLRQPFSSIWIILSLIWPGKFLMVFPGFNLWFSLPLFSVRLFCFVVFERFFFGWVVSGASNFLVICLMSVNFELWWLVTTFVWGVSVSWSVSSLVSVFILLCFFRLFSGLIAVVVSLFVSRDLKHRDARYDDAVPDVKF